EILHLTVASSEKRSTGTTLSGSTDGIAAVVDGIGTAVVAETKVAEPLNVSIGFPEDRFDSVRPARVADDLLVHVDAQCFAASVARQHAEVLEAAGARPEKRSNA